MVFEDEGRSGFFQRIAVVTSMDLAANGYQSTGPTSIPLVAGNDYAIGLGWDERRSLLTRTQYDPPSQKTSFGSLFNSRLFNNPDALGIDMTGASSYVSDFFFAQRLETGP